MKKPAALPFKEQIEYFKNKVPLSTTSWQDIQDKQHDAAFVVAGATAGALLGDLQDAVLNMIEKGQTLHDFRKKFAQIVKTNGWVGWTGSNTKKGVAWRTNIIYETNLNTSYAAGRWRQIQLVKKQRPYLLYRHNNNVMMPRHVHVKWDKTVLEVDNDWWKTHFPPNGFGCKCQVYSMSSEDLVKRGLSVTPDKQIPPGKADRSFGYIPGVSTPPITKDGKPVKVKIPTTQGAKDQRNPRKIEPNNDSEVKKNQAESPATAKIIDAKDQAKRIEEVLKQLEKESVAVDGSKNKRTIKSEGVSVEYADNLIEQTLEAVADFDVNVPMPLLYNNQVLSLTESGSTENDTIATMLDKRAKIKMEAQEKRAGTDTTMFDAEYDVASFSRDIAVSFAIYLYGDISPPPNSVYASITKDEPPPTKYGEIGLAEDWADSVTMYYRQPNKLKNLAPERYIFIGDILKYDWHLA